MYYTYLCYIPNNILLPELLYIVYVFDEIKRTKVKYMQSDIFPFMFTNSGAFISLHGFELPPGVISF